MDLPLIETGRITEMKVSCRGHEVTVRPMYGFDPDLHWSGWDRPILGWVVLLRYGSTQEYALPALLPSCEEATQFGVQHLKRLDKALRKQQQREDSFNERTLQLCQAYPAPADGFYRTQPRRDAEDLPVDDPAVEPDVPDSHFG